MSTRPSSSPSSPTLSAAAKRSLNLEASYDWSGEQWTVPVNAGYAKVFSVGTQAMSFQLGARYYLEAPEGGPDWGLRSTLTFLFPEGP
jgi:hypothetical protein